jgi:Fe-S-cluster-containing hydrogenase component 2
MAIFIEDHCIGCGLCAHNCPYGSIHMHELGEGRRRAGGTARREATNCDLCESLDGDPRCVKHCPHEAAVRMPGIDLARRVGLTPAGIAGPPGLKK